MSDRKPKSMRRMKAEDYARRARGGDDLAGLFEFALHEGLMEGIAAGVEVAEERKDRAAIRRLREIAANTPTPEPIPAPSSSTAPRADSPYYGKDCPKGMVQVEFVGCSPSARMSDYGWRPVDHAFLEVWVDGKRFRIDVGDFHDGRAQRRGLHIVTDIGVGFAQTSMNAASLYLDAPAPAPRQPSEPVDGCPECFPASAADGPRCARHQAEAEAWRPSAPAPQPSVSVQAAQLGIRSPLTVAPARQPSEPGVFRGVIPGTCPCGCGSRTLHGHVTEAARQPSVSVQAAQIGIRSPLTAEPAPDPSRCTVCGSNRIPLDRAGTRFGACSLVPGNDGKGGCPDPLRDCDRERAARQPSDTDTAGWGWCPNTTLRIPKGECGCCPDEPSSPSSTKGTP